MHGRQSQPSVYKCAVDYVNTLGVIAAFHCLRYSQGQQRRKHRRRKKNTFPLSQSKIKGCSPKSTDIGWVPPSERKQEEKSTSPRHHGKCRLDKTRGRLCSQAASVNLPAETAGVFGRLSLRRDVYEGSEWRQRFNSVVVRRVPAAAAWEKDLCSLKHDARGCVLKYKIKIKILQKR